MSFESRGAHKSKKQPVYLPSASIASLPHVFHARVFFFLFPFLLLLGLLDFVRSVANLLNARIDLLQLRLRRIVLRNDLRSRFLHDFALTHKTLDGTVQLLSTIFPELSCVLRFIFGINEIYSRLKLI